MRPLVAVVDAVRGARPAERARLAGTGVCQQVRRQSGAVDTRPPDSGARATQRSDRAALMLQMAARRCPPPNPLSIGSS
jgi:hypothetical protein